MTHTLWILWALLIFTPGDRVSPENAPCPEGSRVHLSSLRCYWLSRTTSSFPEAWDSCKDVHGGDLAAANSLELQNFLHHSFPAETTVWVWLKTSGGGGSDQGGGLETSGHAGWAGPSDSGGGCTVMALGTLGPGRRTPCAGQFHFLCESLITGVLPTTDSYLTGLVLMSGVYPQTQIFPLLSVPDTGQDTVELLLFPGLWFSHAGQLVAVELVVRPSPLASMARVQILRPYCDPNLHLVPPGCSSLLNPFSCCTAVPLCNTTGGCSAGQYWCPLLDTCVPTTSPCSPYDTAAAVRGFESPPRYLETPPFYHMVADLPLEIEPSSELKTTKVLLPDRAITVYPDDVVAVQHTRASGAFLHCLKSEASVNSPWRQSYLSLMGAERGGWWRAGLTSLPPAGQWVDGVVCDLRMLYVDSLHRGTEQEDAFGLTHTEATTALSLMTVGPSLSLSPKFGLSVIHPLPDAKRHIHIQIDLLTHIVITASSGAGATSSWSAPVSQTGVPFLPSLPHEVTSSWPHDQRPFGEAWYSSVTLSLASVGVQTMNITAMDAESSESLSVTVCGYEAVAGLSVEPRGLTRMLVNISQVFNAQLEKGSSAKFRWVTDDLESSAHEGESYRALFQKPAQHRLEVSASNPVSSQSLQLLLTVDDATLLAEPEFLSVSEVVAANATHPYCLRVKADVSAPVTFRWDFGDRRGKMTTSRPAPGQTVLGLMEGQIKQAYVQDSVNYTYSTPGDYTLHVRVVTEYDSTEASVKINVRRRLGHIQISASPPVPVVEQAVLLEASSEPSAASVLYTWDFGDGSQRVNHPDGPVSHVYHSPGTYTARVSASNAVSEVERSITVEVFERLDGLRIRCSSLTDNKYVPTREELRFLASIAKGSHVSYRWLAVQSRVNQQTTGDRELFRLLAKTPGEISVQLVASNKLGEATTAVSLKAVERVASVQIKTQSNAVALGKLVQISVSASVGSDLEYLWYVDSDSSPLTTQAPVLFHTFTHLGSCLVTVSVQNVLSQSNATERFSVQQAVEGVDFKIKGITAPFYVSSSTAVTLCGVFAEGSDLRWDWTLLDPRSSVFIATNQTFSHSFPHSGSYQVSLNVSNDISWQVVSHRVVAQDRVEGLHLNVSKPLLCAEEEVTLVPTISRGSNVSFAVTVRNGEWIHSQSRVEGKYTTSTLPVGSNLITVRVWNQVSSEELSTDVLVMERVGGLSLVNRSVALEALKGAHFRAEVQRGGPVTYTWTFGTGPGPGPGPGPALLTGQEVSFTPAESGWLSVSVVASNGACSRELTEIIAVERPVTMIQLLCDAERSFLGRAVGFSATVDGGSNLRYHWDFGDFTEATVTESKFVSHTYHRPGEFSVTVRAVNSVSHVSTQLHVTVEELPCSSPQASLVQSRTTIFRSRPSFFEASVTVNCSAFKPAYLWEVYAGSDCANASGSRTVLRGEADAASPSLSLPKNSLRVGRHCLVFTLSLRGSPLSAQSRATVTVVHSPLVALIKGGSFRLWSSLSDLILDGSDSQDPDEEPGEGESLQYQWTCVTPSSTEVQFFSQSSTTMTVLSSQLHAGTVYTFTLTVLKTGRTPASASQTVSVTPAPVLPVTLECVSCSVVSSSHLFTHTNALIMSGQCGQCGDSAQYTWRAESQAGGILDLDDITTSTGRRSPHLVVRSGVLQPGLSYTFTLNVSQLGRGRWGVASLSVLPNSPPRGGLCDLSPESNIRLLETVVTYNCSGWQDDESEASQLIYSLQVAPCHPISNECPMLLLYRGIRSAFSSVLPMGTQRQGSAGSVVTAVLLVEDHLGAKVTALSKTLSMENPAWSQGATDWLKSRSQKELRALVQRGDPQEIVSYSTVLTAQLNKMQATLNGAELMDRRTIRETVTRALTSLPLSSMLDVDQISSALAQSTNVPAELVCENCHKQLLRAVGEMIGLMEDQLIPGASAAVRTGGNILNILGSTLAASGLHSSVALSALSHTGALMRSLMRSQFAGVAPLLLSNPYITTLGFRGDPSDLLCTGHLNQPRRWQNSPADASNSSQCLFSIPDSLTAHLRSQRTEVVQVLVAADGAAGSGPSPAAAGPPISTGVVAMEITTPQGRPVHIRDLQPEQAIRVALHNRGGAGSGTCLAVTLATEQLNFTVTAPDELGENAGLYLSFSFSRAPGCTRVTLGRVKVEVSSSGPEANASHNSLVREWDFTLSAQSLSAERTVFLSPLLNETDERLSVNVATLSGGGESVRLSLCAFSSVCRYYNPQEARWSSEGLRPLEGSTLHTVHCLTQHLTMFGASLFLHPGAVVLLQPSAGPVQSVVPGIVCAVLVLIHLVAGLIAHKLDHLDDLRQSRVPLCGRPGLYHYRVLVKTGWRRGAGTSAHVGIGLYGVNKSGSRHLQRDGAFQRGGLDQFQLETDENLGEVWKIRIWHDNTGLDPSWYLEHVVVWDAQTDRLYFFLLNDWLSVESEGNGAVEREVLASCPEELCEFRRVLASQLRFGMMERHAWLSLWARPAHSCVTRGQRVVCSAVTLHLYLALGALWYGAVGTEGHSGPVSARLLLNAETVAVGMTLALLAFPLQCLLGFRLRKSPSKVTVDMLASPSPDCHSVEMDIYLGQSGLSSPSFVSLPDTSTSVSVTGCRHVIQYHQRHHLHPSCYCLQLLESKGIDSSLLDFWATSGLAPQTQAARDGEEADAWSCDSFFDLPLSSGHSEASAPPAVGALRPLRRKKALLELGPVAPSSSRYQFLKGSSDFNKSPDAPGQEVLTVTANQAQGHKHSLATFLTLSEEDLLTSIVAASEDPAASTPGSSDSGWDSPAAPSSLSPAWSSSCSSWSDRSLRSSLRRCPSALSVDSVASTFLPSPSPDSARSSFSTRIGVARGPPGRSLPPWALCAAPPLLAVLLGTSLAVIGLYGSFLPRPAVLMWLVSALCAFLASAVLLEPLKVCAGALICAAVWRPVDPEVEEQLARDAAAVRALGERCRKVRPPGGFGLLQAKEEARKVQALRSLMRRCVGQLFFVMLVLMVNYQDSVGQSQGRRLQSWVRRGLHAAPPGGNNLTSLRDWSDAERWLGGALVRHLHQNPSLRLVGSARLRHGEGGLVLGNSSEATRRLLAGLRVARWSRKMFKTLSVDFTQHHRQSGLLVCVSLQLAWNEAQTLTPSLSIYPLLIPPSASGLDLQGALMVLLLVAALLIFFAEMWSLATERAQYLRQCKHWLQLLLALLSLATAVLHLSFLSLAASCVSELQSRPDGFISFHSAALRVQRSSQCAAVLLTLLLLKALRTLRFVRRWAAMGRVLRGAWRELWAFAVLLLLLLLLLLCVHLGDALLPRSLGGFPSAREAWVSALSALRGRGALRRMCRAHPAVGPVYGLLLIRGAFWLLARLCGAVLIRTYREERAELYHPAVEPQDYEMVEFFIKRLKLWLGLTKAREFRHRVTFEGMDAPPSRSSQDSRLSTASSTLPFSRSPSFYSSASSPSSLSSVLSTASGDSSASEAASGVLSHGDRLLPCVNAVLSQFDRVIQISEEVHNLEMKLDEAETRRRRRRIVDEGKSAESFREEKNVKEGEDEGRVPAEVRRRKTGVFYPRQRVSLPSCFPFNTSTLPSNRIYLQTQNSHSDFDSVLPQVFSSKHSFEANPIAGSRSSCPTASPDYGPFPRRRAWHSGISHSADAAQRACLLHGGAVPCLQLTDIRPRSEEGIKRRVSDGVPVKRKAWISEGPDTQD
ncbi:polycystin-1 [Betta splendens]|uniref:Polycystin-1 n=1 Tax=Betta splendens TaxID=158456 RepID=A0A8M1H789_BETSP|nr:polycystin-1 [Betta splendens]